MSLVQSPVRLFFIVKINVGFSFGQYLPTRVATSDNDDRILDENFIFFENNYNHGDNPIGSMRTSLQ